MRRVVLLAMAVVAFVAPPAAAQTEPAPPDASTTTTVPPTMPDGSPDLQSRSWLVIDAATGAVLKGYDIHSPQLTASTVKMVTALTALRLLGPVALINVSEAAATRPARKINMLAGQQWAMRDTLWCLMLVSANDAAYALAETAGGSLEGFAAEMAETGERLGLRESTFADPAGFDHELDTLIGPSLMSAWDLAIVGRAVLADPVLAPMVASPDYAFNGPDGAPHTLTNHNKLLEWYPGVVGVKTGFTNAAQGTFVAAAERDNRRLIGVVMGAPAGIYDPMVRLLDYGFTLAPATDAQVLPAPVDPALPPTTAVAATIAPSTAAPTTAAPTTDATAPVTTAARTAMSAPAASSSITTPPSAVDDPEAAALNGAPLGTGGGTSGGTPLWPAAAAATGMGVAATVAARRVAAHRQRRRRDRELQRVLTDAPH